MIESCLNDFNVYCSLVLFQYHGELIEINLVGGVIPIVVSILFLFLLKKENYLRVEKYSLLVSGIYSTAWISFDKIEGGIALAGYLVAIVYFVGSIVWLRFNFAKVRSESVGSIMLEIYCTGTFAVFLSDVTRILGGFLGLQSIGISAHLEVIGGAWIADGLFRAGLIFISIFVGCWMIMQAMHLISISRFEKRTSNVLQ